MQIKNKKQIISISLSVIVSVFLVSLAVYAATTIGSNITTGGTLSVTGDASFSTASTTGNFWLGNQTADDDDFLYMDASSTEYLMWDDSANQFVFSNGVSIPSATTTDSLYIGGIASTTGAVYVGMLSAAGDDYLYFDANESLESLMWDDDPGKFVISDDLQVTGVGTSTIAIWAGTGGTVDNIDLTGGDLYVQNDAEIDGGLYVDSATTTDTTSIGSGVAIREFNWGTCDFADTAVTASSTATVFCNNATGIASGDNVFVTATSSFDTEFVIQTASSTATDVIQLRVFNLGTVDDDSLDGTTLNWQSIR